MKLKYIKLNHEILCILRCSASVDELNTQLSIDKHKTFAIF